MALSEAITKTLEEVSKIDTHGATENEKYLNFLKHVYTLTKEQKQELLTLAITFSISKRYFFKHDNGIVYGAKIELMVVSPCCQHLALMLIDNEGIQPSETDHKYLILNYNTMRKSVEPYVQVFNDGFMGIHDWSGKFRLADGSHYDYLLYKKFYEAASASTSQPTAELSIIKEMLHKLQHKVTTLETKECDSRARILDQGKNISTLSAKLEETSKQLLELEQRCSSLEAQNQALTAALTKLNASAANSFKEPPSSAPSPASPTMF